MNRRSHSARSLTTRLKKPPTEAPRTAIVRTANLSHSYKKRRALTNISLEVFEGEILGVLGPNGGGKSTLFRILSTALLPSSGDASVAGESVVTRAYKVRERIGVVFQSFGLDKKLTVAENLRLQGNMYGLLGDVLETRITELLETFRLDDRRNDLIDNLSGGLQRRVEIAKGVLHSPSVLLLDEPSTGLDPAARLELWDFLRLCRSEGNMTIILTTHLAEEAERCDRIAILDEGSVVTLGKPGELRAEIGGDIIVIQSPNLRLLKRKVQRTLKHESTIVKEELHIETRNGHQFIPQLIRSFPALVASVTLRKPTLEDVFLQRTGRRLDISSSAGNE